jgi:3-oxoacyl-[acyl-carrier-protein] synthase II
MLALIGRGGGTETCQVQPFEQSRRGVLLGEGAAAVVLQRIDQADGAPAAVVRGVGLVCDAKHATAPDRDGILACMRDAYERAGVQPRDIDLVVAHGTGTALNDPVEASALAEVLGARAAEVPVTAIKAGTGHTSGSSALMSLIIAIRSLVAGLVPPIGGLTDPIPEAAPLRLVHGEPLCHRGTIAQINSFGFGGVNAVTIVEVTP